MDRSQLDALNDLPTLKMPNKMQTFPLFSEQDDIYTPQNLKTGSTKRCIDIIHVACSCSS